MECIPVLIEDLGNPAQLLRRIESKPSSCMDESWLQSLIFEKPDLLPVYQFNENAAPLIPLGREIGVATGYIDNLYVSPYGQLTIVETKLWKNPEQHRVVVAQIIDYAKELSSWTYDDLNQAVLKAARQSDLAQVEDLDQLVKPSLESHNITLPEFQDRVSASLRHGKFLLLIVGDKLQPNLLLLTDVIHGGPGLEFTIGLVELQLHPLKEDSDWPLLVIPQVVGRTIEQVRNIIKIEVQYKEEKPGMNIEVTEGSLTPESKETISQEEFLESVPRDLMPVYRKWIEIWNSEVGVNVKWATTGFGLYVRRQKGANSVLSVNNTNVWVYTEKSAQSQQVPFELCQEYMNKINAITEVINRFAMGYTSVRHDSITADDLDIVLEATTSLAREIKGL